MYYFVPQATMSNRYDPAAKSLSLHNLYFDEGKQQR